MSIPSSLTPLFLSAEVSVEPDPPGPSYTGLQISRSVRFNPDDSATFTRAFGAGNQSLWTWSGWVKRTALGEHILFGTQTSGSDIGFFGFGGDDSLGFNNRTSAGTGFQGDTFEKFNDLSSWYHIMFVFDGIQASFADRGKIYVNGTLSPINGGAQAAGPGFLNCALTHALGARFLFGGTSIHTAAYMADVYFIDGQALTPSSFGQTDTAYGNQWVPIAYSGSYGTNGFSLKFSDNSAATSSTLGKDSSGNNNDWTPNNMSVTAGVGNDSFVESCTNYGTDTGVGGEVRSNYATLNPRATPTGTSIFSNGNLEMVGSSWGRGLATFLIPENTGKYYWEVTTISGNEFIVGMETFDNGQTSGNPTLFRSGGYGYVWNGTYYAAGTQVGSGYPFYNTAGTITQFAFDSATKKLWFGNNGTWLNSGNPATGANASLTLSGTAWYPTINIDTGHKLGINFGQRPFIYTAPSGFKTLCATNLLLNTITTTGSFEGNASTNGPFVFLKGVPTAMSINGNAVTFGTHANKLSNGFKVISSSGSYNTSGSNSYSITTTGDKFKYARAQPNP